MRPRMMTYFLFSPMQWFKTISHVVIFLYKCIYENGNDETTSPINADKSCSQDVLEYVSFEAVSFADAKRKESLRFKNRKRK